LLSNRFHGGIWSVQKPPLPPSFTMVQIGTRLAELRKAKGLRPVEFCRPVGVAANTWSQWENGKRLPNLEDMTRVCAVFGATLDFIYLGRMDALPHDTATEISELRRLYPDGLPENVVRLAAERAAAKGRRHEKREGASRAKK
jgi:transcriptional regulator with XRE-family HTH domain